ncbi:hypothetical protein NHX12_019717 [Muraenolepis orangiensis]|uniref:Uncharacterized protein n=1 Tax=Muraenolepis orangiensis TaxID=630683 RepID=A0A9Q0IXG8_9TELE|nr:hypothetical protein NHX12_019717 [Muraenolepis orangiensis]
MLTVQPETMVNVKLQCERFREVQALVIIYSTMVPPLHLLPSSPAASWRAAADDGGRDDVLSGTSRNRPPSRQNIQEAFNGERVHRRETCGVSTTTTPTLCRKKKK